MVHAHGPWPVDLGTGKWDWYGTGCGMCDVGWTQPGPRYGQNLKMLVVWMIPYTRGMEITGIASALISSVARRWQAVVLNRASQSGMESYAELPRQPEVGGMVHTVVGSSTYRRRAVES